MKRTVRISGIEIKNFKNVVKGTLFFDNPRKDYKASILGLYGQNGSGKTALIDSIELLKKILDGKSADAFYSDYINVDHKEAEITYYFNVVADDKKKAVQYTVTLKKEERFDDNNEKKEVLIICKELLKCPIISEKGVKTGKLIDTDTEDIFVPVAKKQLLVGKSNKNDMYLMVSKKIAEAQSKSFIFSNELFENIFERLKSNDLSETERKEIEYYLNILSALKRYGNSELFVYNKKNSAVISLNAQPLLFSYKDKQIGIAHGSMIFPLNEPCVIPENYKNVADKVLSNMNLVLKQLVPGLTISMKELGTQVMENGDVGFRVQFMSNKNNKEIPLSYESEGIKKIISILQLLIVVFNEESVTVAVDELDSGIFEYLLGELLNIISEQGNGQLIFTSHNLRPLETLDVGFVAFTTTNPENRYVRLKGTKDTNNVRDCYYRNIMLNTSEEELYDHTNNSEIAFAFMEAGEYGDR